MVSCSFATSVPNARLGDMRSRSIFSAPCIAALALACNDPAPSNTSSTSSSTQSDPSGSPNETETETNDETETGTVPDMPAPPLAPEPMVVMTFNILCSFCDDTYDPWEVRVGYI